MTGSRTLTAEQVLEIRDRVALGETREAVAREYGVSGVTVGRIVQFATWKRADEEVLRRSVTRARTAERRTDLMIDKPENPHAFPRTVGSHTHSGMTLRDYFAAHASEQDVMAHRTHLDADPWGYANTPEQARYAFADAMLAARQEPR